MPTFNFSKSRECKLARRSALKRKLKKLSRGWYLGVILASSVALLGYWLLPKFLTFNLDNQVTTSILNTRYYVSSAVVSPQESGSLSSFRLYYRLMNEQEQQTMRKLSKELAADPQALRKVKQWLHSLAFDPLQRFKQLSLQPWAAWHPVSAYQLSYLYGYWQKNLTLDLKKHPLIQVKLDPLFQQLSNSLPTHRILLESVKLSDSTNLTKQTTSAQLIKHNLLNEPNKQPVLQEQNKQSLPHKLKEQHKQELQELKDYKDLQDKVNPIAPRGKNKQAANVSLTKDSSLHIFTNYNPQTGTKLFPFLPDTTKFVKYVIGYPLDLVDLCTEGLFINGIFIRELPPTILQQIKRHPQQIRRICLEENEYWVYGDAATSIDSLYFGKVNAEQITAKVIWAF